MNTEDRARIEVQNVSPDEMICGPNGMVLSIPDETDASEEIPDEMKRYYTALAKVRKRILDARAMIKKLSGQELRDALNDDLVNTISADMELYEHMLQHFEQGVDERWPWAIGRTIWVSTNWKIVCPPFPRECLQRAA